MRLKVLTTFTFLLGIAAAAYTPWVLHMKPARVDGHPPSARLAQAFVLALYSYMAATIFLFVAAAAFAMLLLYQTREVFKSEHSQRLQDLVEGSLNDIRAKGQGQGSA